MRVYDSVAPNGMDHVYFTSNISVNGILIFRNIHIFKVVRKNRECETFGDLAESLLQIDIKRK